jgi:hypothetical protein
MSLVGSAAKVQGIVKVGITQFLESVVRFPRSQGLAFNSLPTMPICCRGWGLGVENVKTGRGGKHFLNLSQVAITALPLLKVRLY